MVRLIGSAYQVGVAGNGGCQSGPESPTESQKYCKFATNKLLISNSTDLDFEMLLELHSHRCFWNRENRGGTFTNMFGKVVSIGE